MTRERPSWILGFGALSLAVCVALPAFAQEEGGQITEDDGSWESDYEVQEIDPSGDGKSQNAVPKAVPDVIEDKWKATPKKIYSPAENKAECRKYEGKVISFYESVYRVENCKRREIADPDEISKIQKANTKILSIDNDTIIKIPLGKPMESKAASKTPPSCQVLNGQYIISLSNEIYFIEGCRKRFLPDYETYWNHKVQNKKVQATLIELNNDQLAKVATGKAYPTVFNDATLRNEDEITEILPLHEACRGLDGKYVSYYSLLYKIENCRKREIADHQQFFLELKNKKVAIRELSSEQWISLPDGKRIENAKKDPR